MKVKAIKTGFIFGVLMKKGDEFTLTSKEQFSSNWMRQIEEVKPKKTRAKKIKD
jgi:hypothetical protein